MQWWRGVALLIVHGPGLCTVRCAVVYDHGAGMILHWGDETHCQWLCVLACCADILCPGLALGCGVALPTGVAPRGRPTRCVASIVGDRDAARQPQYVSAARSQPCYFEAACSGGVAWRC